MKGTFLHHPCRCEFIQRIFLHRDQRFLLNRGAVLQNIQQVEE